MSNDPEDGGYDWVTPTQREWPKGKAPARKCTITHDEDGGYAGVEKEAPPCWASFTIRSRTTTVCLMIRSRTCERVRTSVCQAGSGA